MLLQHTAVVQHYKQILRVAETYNNLYYFAVVIFLVSIFALSRLVVTVAARLLVKLQIQVVEPVADVADKRKLRP